MFYENRNWKALTVNFPRCASIKENLQPGLFNWDLSKTFLVLYKYTHFWPVDIGFIHREKTVFNCSQNKQNFVLISNGLRNQVCIFLTLIWHFSLKSEIKDFLLTLAWKQKKLTSHHPTTFAWASVNMVIYSRARIYSVFARHSRKFIYITSWWNSSHCYLCKIQN